MHLKLLFFSCQERREILSVYSSFPIKHSPLIARGRRPHAEPRKNYCVLCCLCYLCCCCYSVLADYSRSIAGELQEVGLQGPDKEAPTSHRIPRINNEPSRPTEGVRFCLSERSIPFHQQVLFESNNQPYVIMLTVNPC